MADPLETYNHVPLHIDPTSKTISASAPKSLDPATLTAIENLNSLHATLKTLETPNQIPPAPVPVLPKRSAQIAKLRDSAQAAHRKAQFADAARLWTFAIEMAGSRPAWEPAGLVREELSALYAGRAAAGIAQQRWVEAYKDAQMSTECKAGPAVGPQGQRGPGNTAAWVLGSRCLGEMGRWGEVVEWLERGVEVEGVGAGGAAGQGDDGKTMVKLLAEARKEADKGAVRR